MQAAQSLRCVPAHPELADDPLVLERVVVVHVSGEDVLHVAPVLRRGARGVRSQHNDEGVYTDWDTIME
jgi:hypothetical protein